MGTRERLSGLGPHPMAAQTISTEKKTRCTRIDALTLPACYLATKNNAARRRSGVFAHVEEVREREKRADAVNKPRRARQTS